MAQVTSYSSDHVTDHLPTATSSRTCVVHALATLSSLLTFPILLVLNTACGELPGFKVNEKADGFQQAAVKNNKIDLLFIMDNSGSMAREQQSVADSFEKFIGQFSSRNMDFHVGVITTDTLNNPNWWSNQLAVKPYINIPNNGAGSLLAKTGNDRYLTQNTPNFIQEFKDNINLGILGDGAEAGILSATMALAPAMIGSGGWNEGFVRSDAYLAIIVISDEDESNAVGANGTIRATYIKNDATARATRVNNFITEVQALKPSRPDMVRFDAIVAPSVALCPTLGSSGQDQGIGDVYMQVAGLLNGTVANVCEDFSGSLADLGQNILMMITRFKLVQPPDGDIQVVVDGNIVPMDATNGWTWHADTLEIEFHGTAIPGLSAVINVNYTPLKPL